MQRFDTIEALQAAVGREVCVSDWLSVDQARIDRFADATGDHQWIHVDPERAARESPYGGTIAHGYLTLSLVAHFATEAFVPLLPPARMSINYGLNRVRFPQAVKAGSRLRGRFVLKSVEPLAGGAQIESTVTVEIEGSAKPACVAESVVRRYFAAQPAA